jgi:hypothetical protein
MSPFSRKKVYGDETLPEDFPGVPQLPAIYRKVKFQDVSQLLTQTMKGGILNLSMRSQIFL